MRILYKGDYVEGAYAPGSVCRFPDGVLRVRTYEETWEPVDSESGKEDDSPSA